MEQEAEKLKRNMLLIADHAEGIWKKSSQQGISEHAVSIYKLTSGGNVPQARARFGVIDFFGFKVSCFLLSNVTFSDLHFGSIKLSFKPYFYISYSQK
jgi:hypothetical protein